MTGETVIRQVSLTVPSTLVGVSAVGDGRILLVIAGGSEAMQAVMPAADALRISAALEAAVEGEPLAAMEVHGHA